MSGVLILLVGGPFAALGAWAWRARLQARRRSVRRNAVQHREDFVLRAVGALVDASRVSSNAVIAKLDETIRAQDPHIDAFLAFAPAGDELACVYASGERVAHYSALRLRRDAERYLPAKAAIAGHRACGTDGVMIPTDRRALAVPMRDDAGLRAVIYVSSPSGGALAAEETIVRTIEHAATPYTLALEREADRADSTYDGLTGLLTPRAFRARLSLEIDRAQFRASSNILTLWFIDTDRFKNVNDTFGHAAGDAVLQAMAELIRAQLIPEIDVAARNGGDEFCALLFDSQKTSAIERAQSLCDAVRRHDFGPGIDITASIGVATYPYDARAASELLELADAAMYHSKRTGRDRVSFAVNGATFSIFR